MAATRIMQGGPIVDAVSMAATFTSDTLDVSGAAVAGLQFVAASATHAGTFAVQLSIDGETWKAVPFRISSGAMATSVSASNGAALSELAAVDVSMARRLRVVYTASSGTGTAYVHAIKKAGAATTSLAVS